MAGCTGQGRRGFSGEVRLSSDLEQSAAHRGAEPRPRKRTLELTILISQWYQLKGTKLCSVLNATLRSCNLFKKEIVSWG